MPKSQNPNPGTASSSHRGRSSKAISNKNSKAESVSKYFTRNKIDENNPTSTSAYSNNLTKIKKITLNDDDDFKTPKPVKKLAKIFANPVESQTQAKRKVIRKGRSTKKDSMQKTIEDAFKKADVHGEHLQMAIALSISAHEAQKAKMSEVCSGNNSEDVGDDDDEYKPVLPSTQDVRDNVKKTLEQYGFKSSRGGSSELCAVKNTEGSRRKKKSRYHYVKPILFIRTDEKREEIINSKIARILTHPSSIQASESTQKIENLTLHSQILNKYHYTDSNTITRDNIPLSELMNHTFYVQKLNLSPSECKCGSSLKRWEEIPGREVSPVRNPIGLNEELQDRRNPSVGQKEVPCEKEEEENVENLIGGSKQNAITICDNIQSSLLYLENPPIDVQRYSINSKNSESTEHEETIRSKNFTFISESQTNINNDYEDIVQTTVHPNFENSSTKIQKIESPIKSACKIYNSMTIERNSSQRKIRSPSPDIFDTDEDTLVTDEKYNEKNISTSPHHTQNIKDDSSFVSTAENNCHKSEINFKLTQTDSDKKLTSIEVNNETRSNLGKAFLNNDKYMQGLEKVDFNKMEKIHLNKKLNFSSDKKLTSIEVNNETQNNLGKAFLNNDKYIQSLEKIDFNKAEKIHPNKKLNFSSDEDDEVHEKQVGFKLTESPEINISSSEKANLKFAEKTEIELKDKKLIQKAELNLTSSSFVCTKQKVFIQSKDVPLSKSKSLMNTGDNSNQDSVFNEKSNKFNKENTKHFALSQKRNFIEVKDDLLAKSVFNEKSNKFNKEENTNNFALSQKRDFIEVKDDPLAKSITNVEFLNQSSIFDKKSTESYKEAHTFELPSKKRKRLENNFSASLLSNLHNSSTECTDNRDFSDCEIIETDNGICHFESFCADEEMLSQKCMNDAVEIISSDDESVQKCMVKFNRSELNDEIFNDVTIDAEYLEHNGDEEYRKDDHNFPNKKEILFDDTKSRNQNQNFITHENIFFTNRDDLESLKVNSESGLKPSTQIDSLNFEQKEVSYFKNSICKATVDFNKDNCDGKILSSFSKEEINTSKAIYKNVSTSIQDCRNKSLKLNFTANKSRKISKKNMQLNCKEEVDLSSEEELDFELSSSQNCALKKSQTKNSLSMEIKNTTKNVEASVKSHNSDKLIVVNDFDDFNEKKNTTKHLEASLKSHKSDELIVVNDFDDFNEKTNTNKNLEASLKFHKSDELIVVNDLDDFNEKKNITKNLEASVKSYKSDELFVVNDFNEKKNITKNLEASVKSYKSDELFVVNDFNEKNNITKNLEASLKFHKSDELIVVNDLDDFNEKKNITKNLEASVKSYKSDELFVVNDFNEKNNITKNLEASVKSYKSDELFVVNDFDLGKTFNPGNSMHSSTPNLKEKEFKVENKKTSDTHLECLNNFSYNSNRTSLNITEHINEILNNCNSSFLKDTFDNTSTFLKNQNTARKSDNEKLFQENIDRNGEEIKTTTLNYSAKARFNDGIDIDKQAIDSSNECDSLETIDLSQDSDNSETGATQSKSKTVNSDEDKLFQQNIGKHNKMIKESALNSNGACFNSEIKIVKSNKQDILNLNSYGTSEENENLSETTENEKYASQHSKDYEYFEIHKDGDFADRQGCIDLSQDSDNSESESSKAVKSKHHSEIVSTQYQSIENLSQEIENFKNSYESKTLEDTSIDDILIKSLVVNDIKGEIISKKMEPECSSNNYNKFKEKSKKMKKKKLELVSSSESDSELNSIDNKTTSVTGCGKKYSTNTESCLSESSEQRAGISPIEHSSGNIFKGHSSDSEYDETSKQNNEDNRNTTTNQKRKFSDTKNGNRKRTNTKLADKLVENSKNIEENNFEVSNAKDAIENSENDKTSETKFQVKRIKSKVNSNSKLINKTGSQYETSINEDKIKKSIIKNKSNQTKSKVNSNSKLINKTGSQCETSINEDKIKEPIVKNKSNQLENEETSETQLEATDIEGIITSIDNYSNDSEKERNTNIFKSNSKSKKAQKESVTTSRSLRSSSSTTSKRKSDECDFPKRMLRKKRKKMETASSSENKELSEDEMNHESTSEKLEAVKDDCNKFQSLEQTIDESKKMETIIGDLCKLKTNAKCENDLNQSKTQISSSRGFKKLINGKEDSQASKIEVTCKHLKKYAKNSDDNALTSTRTGDKRIVIRNIDKAVINNNMENLSKINKITSNDKIDKEVLDFGTKCANSYLTNINDDKGYGSTYTTNISKEVRTFENFKDLSSRNRSSSEELKKSSHSASFDSSLNFKDLSYQNQSSSEELKKSSHSASCDSSLNSDIDTSKSKSSFKNHNSFESINSLDSIYISDEELNYSSALSKTMRKELVSESSDESNNSFSIESLDDDEFKSLKNIESEETYKNNDLFENNDFGDKHNNWETEKHFYLTGEYFSETNKITSVENINTPHLNGNMSQESIYISDEEPENVCKKTTLLPEEINLGNNEETDKHINPTKEYFSETNKITSVENINNPHLNSNMSHESIYISDEEPENVGKKTISLPEEINLGINYGVINSAEDQFLKLKTTVNTKESTSNNEHFQNDNAQDFISRSSGAKDFNLQNTNQTLNEQMQNPVAMKKKSRFEISDSESDDDKVREGNESTEMNNIGMTTLLKQLEFVVGLKDNYIDKPKGFRTENKFNESDDVVEIVDEDGEDFSKGKNNSDEKSMTEDGRFEFNSTTHGKTMIEDRYFELNATDDRMVLNNLNDDYHPGDDCIGFDLQTQKECFIEDTAGGNDNEFHSERNNLPLNENINEHISGRNSANELTERNNVNQVTQRNNANQITERNNANQITERNNANRVTERNNANQVTERNNANYITERNNQVTERHNANQVTEEIDLCSESNSPIHQTDDYNKNQKTTYAVSPNPIHDEDTEDYFPKETHFIPISQNLENVHYMNNSREKIIHPRLNELRKSVLKKPALEPNPIFEDTFANLLEQTDIITAIDNNIAIKAPNLTNEKCINSHIANKNTNHEAAEYQEVNKTNKLYDYPKATSSINSGLGRITSSGYQEVNKTNNKLYNYPKATSSINSGLGRITSSPSPKTILHTTMNLTPEKLMSDGSFETPNGRVIMKTRNVTPFPDYDDMSTPRLHKELARFGLKKMKRKRGVEMLKYIYESTHPVVGCYDDDDADEGGRVKRRRLILNDDDKLGKDCDEIRGNAGLQAFVEDLNNDNRLQINDESNNPETYCQALKQNWQHADSIKCIGDTVNQGEPEENMIFERTRSKRILSCQLPLHIAWHNLLSVNPNIQENILLYEPLQVEVLYGMLKDNGFKYNIQDIISFLDKKCITIRMNQN